MKRITPILVGILVTVIAAISYSQVHAGEPTGEIGPMNPTMFKCVSRDGTDLIQPDPFRKPLARVFVRGGVEFELARIQDFLKENPDARELTCTSDLVIDFGFDTEDAKAFEGYLEKLKNDCDDIDENAVLVPITDTRIEGFVYEFVPSNPGNPETGEWFAIPHKDIVVEAKGITFNIIWGTDDNGFYYFNNLGAGPILLNLRLPPGAKMINPNVYLDSNGLEETLRATLGFYRGNYKPEPGQISTPDGVPLPLVGLGDIEELSQCGYNDLPSVASSIDPPLAVGDTPAIPDVGGVLPPDSPLTTIVLAVLMLVALPVAGLLKMKNNQPKG
ncbi:MAG: hypothetical protein KDF65_02595 [Anaerolineae bacterium]|nr:hypothetical protein [Anaerolineae bacterium]